MRYSDRGARTHNTGLAKVAVQCSADPFVVNQTLVLRINICAKNPLPSPSPKTVTCNHTQTTRQNKQLIINYFASIFRKC